MALTDYVTLGRSGLRVSPMCLGTMTFGEEWGWGSTVEESEAIMAHYMAEGGNFIDTANAYTNGHSEEIVGDYFAKNGGRDRQIIATKFSTNMYPGDPSGGGSNRKAIIEQCEASLKRLKTDYIDLYWLHFWDRFTPIEETMHALDDLVTSGKVRYIGVSDTPAWKVTQGNLLAEMKGWHKFIALQIEYSLLQRTVEGDLIPMAEELGLGITPWSPLKGGLLTGRFTRENKELSHRGDFTNAALNDHAYDVIDGLIAAAKELDTTPALLALAWVQSRSGVTSTILGARTMDHLTNNLKALEIDIPDDIATKLDALTTPELAFPHDFNSFAQALIQGGTSTNGQTFGGAPIEIE